MKQFINLGLRYCNETRNCLSVTYDTDGNGLAVPKFKNGAGAGFGFEVISTLTPSREGWRWHWSFDQV